MISLTAAQRRLHNAALELFAERGTTQISVSELAQAAGVARGTVYKNLSGSDGLFTEVATQLSADLSERIAAYVKDLPDPALRVATGIRFFARRAHEEPHWGRFICRFALSSASLQEIWSGQPVKDLLAGFETGRFQFQRDQLMSVVAVLAGSALGAIFLVVEGQRTWRDAGSDVAEFVLVSLGVPREEAMALARVELPMLPSASLG